MCDGRRPNKKNNIKHDLKILRNWKASAIASDHRWSMERQSVVAFACAYTDATWGVPVEPIHIHLSVPHGVLKQ